MKTSIALPLIAAALLGLSACAKHETENVTVNETVTNDTSATDLNAVDANATDANAAAVDTGTNASDTLTNG